MRATRWGVIRSGVVLLSCLAATATSFAASENTDLALSFDPAKIVTDGRDHCGQTRRAADPGS